MKLSDFRKILLVYSNLLREMRVDESAMRISSLAEVLPVRSTIKLTDAVDILKTELKSEDKHEFGDRVALLANDLSAILPLVTTVGTPAKTRPVKTLLGLLDVKSSMSINRFLNEVTNAVGNPPDIVGYYSDRLEATYKDASAFAPVFERLTNDKRITKATAIAIAKKFAGMKSKGTKSDALNYIFDRHKYYVGAAAAGKAMGGKSAA